MARHPNHVLAIHSLGLIAAETGNLGPAQDLITTALDIKPDWPEAHNNLGNVQRALGDLDAAIESYRRALALNPDLAGLTITWETSKGTWAICKRPERAFGAPCN